MSDLDVVIVPEQPLDEEAIERLHDRAFGPGRYARTAFRLREGTAGQQSQGKKAVPPAFCFSAHVGTLLVGSVRVSPVMAGQVPALMLGPLTVDPSFEGVGIGAALVRKALGAATDAGEILVLLVGDAPYYSRFGFKVIPPGQIDLPGPVNRQRFLAAELAPGALGKAHGMVKARG